MFTEADVANALDIRIRELYKKLQTEFLGYNILVHHQLCTDAPIGTRPPEWSLCTLKGVNESFGAGEWHDCMSAVSRDDLVRLVFIQAVQR